jgi:hypothetical protein
MIRHISMDMRARYKYQGGSKVLSVDTVLAAVARFGRKRPGEPNHDFPSAMCCVTIDVFEISESSMLGMGGRESAPNRQPFPMVTPVGTNAELPMNDFSPTVASDI